MFRLAFLLLFCGLSSFGRTQGLSPYQASVETSQTPIRSGPGRVHYETDHLNRGSTIEVWRHDPGGWCAIRPPEGSFSWVLKKHLAETNEQNIGKIATDDINAWVGSTDESIKTDMWQVRLKRGELVEILGTRVGLAADGTDEIWYRISPPAGEFRWIHERHIKRDLSQQSIGTNNSRPAPDSTNKIQVTQFQTTDGENDGASSNVDDEGLGGLNVELSRVLAREIRLWEFSPLREKAVANLGRSKTDVQRGHARLLIDKLDHFESLRQSIERDDSGNNSAHVEPDAIRIDSITDDAISLALTNEGVDTTNPRYDGKGWLVPVVPFVGDGPSYAIVDSNGKIQQYVTPTPGLNLHRYLRREVGIFGRRGYIPDADKQHITARRIVVLDRHRR